MRYIKAKIRVICLKRKLIIVEKAGKLLEEKYLGVEIFGEVAAQLIETYGMGVFRNISNMTAERVEMVDEYYQAKGINPQSVQGEPVLSWPQVFAMILEKIEAKKLISVI